MATCKKRNFFRFHSLPFYRCQHFKTCEINAYYIIYYIEAFQEIAFAAVVHFGRTLYSLDIA